MLLTMLDLFIISKKKCFVTHECCAVTLVYYTLLFWWYLQKMSKNGNLSSKHGFSFSMGLAIIIRNMLIFTYSLAHIFLAWIPKLIMKIVVTSLFWWFQQKQIKKVSLFFITWYFWIKRNFKVLHSDSKKGVA